MIKKKCLVCLTIAIAILPTSSWAEFSLNYKYIAPIQKLYTEHREVCQAVALCTAIQAFWYISKKAYHYFSPDRLTLAEQRINSISKRCNTQARNCQKLLQSCQETIMQCSNFIFQLRDLSKDQNTINRKINDKFENKSKNITLSLEKLEGTTKQKIAYINNKVDNLLKKKPTHLSSHYPPANTPSLTHPQRSSIFRPSSRLYVPSTTKKSFPHNLEGNEQV